MLPDLVTSPATDLPIRAVLPQLLATVEAHRTAVLVAPPGTGKTTLVPLAMAATVAGRIVVAQPRRVAARAAAARMAELCGSRVGEAIGYSVRGERRVGPSTRIEVLTTGLLVARMQRDPELPGVDVVILDECHERHLDSDLALAFAVDVRANLRPELRLLAMSATARTDLLAAPVVKAESAIHPVEIVWSGESRRTGSSQPGRVPAELLDEVARSVRRALRDRTGDVLVFLPGIGEINRVMRQLGDLRPDVELMILHGSQSNQSQDAVLRRADRRRVVLASAVAESSLTVPGVRVVVDAGLSRVPRIDLARGLGSLATVRVSRASAEQRAGRAGRQGPGTVYRCWSAVDDERLRPHPEPEIAVADLTGFALQLACWGDPDGDGLALPERPAAAAMEAATTTLRSLGAIDTRGRITERGRRMAGAGTNPRLARALLDGAEVVGARRAAEIVAILAEDRLDSGTSGRGDLVELWQRLRSAADRAATARWRAEVARLRRTAEENARAPLTAQETDRQRPAATPADRRQAAALPDDLAAGLVIGLAFPERLAMARHPGSTSYLMASGTAAELPEGAALTGSPWLAIAVADRDPMRPNARIRLAAAVDEATAREAGAPLLTTTEEVTWVGSELVARRVERLGCLRLAEQRMRAPSRAQVTEAIRSALRHDGIGSLSWTQQATQLRERLAFCHMALGEPWPDVADEALLDRVDEWLGPELAGATRRDDLRRADISAALLRLLPWQLAGRLDQVAPARLPIPGGSRIRVDYADPQRPVLALKVQAAFGWTATPTIADGRVAVVLHLLSPAGRPVAVTSDLDSFWRTGYQQVRAQLRGRYPRHRWPEDPLAQPGPAARPGPTPRPSGRRGDAS